MATTALCDTGPAELPRRWDAAHRTQVAYRFRQRRPNLMVEAPERVCLRRSGRGEVGPNAFWVHRIGDDDDEA